MTLLNFHGIAQGMHDRKPWRSWLSLPCRMHRRTIYDDPFIRNYIEDLLKNIRTQVYTE